MTDDVQLVTLNPGSIKVPVAKGSLSSLSSLFGSNNAESKDFLFNPTTLEERYTPEYARLDPIGYPQKPLHYIGSQNPIYNIELFLDEVEFIKRGVEPQSLGLVETAPTNIEDYRRFLISLTYPSGTNNGSINIPPAKVLFIWPNMLEMICVIRDLSFSHKEFLPNGSSRMYTADLVLEATLENRLFTSSRLRSIISNVSRVRARNR